MWEVTSYLFRSEAELKCDKYISDRWIFLDRIPVVPEFGNSGATGIRPPEIASESKLGCLREGRMQELGEGGGEGNGGLNGLKDEENLGGKNGREEL